MNTTTPQQLLTQIAAIEHMEIGKLSSYVPGGRSADAGPYYKLQCWVDGKNLTRHVRPEELPALKEALEGYARFQDLTQQYAQLLITKTRLELATTVKKRFDPTAGTPERTPARNRSGNSACLPRGRAIAGIGAGVSHCTARRGCRCVRKIASATGRSDRRQLSSHAITSPPPT